MDLRRIMYRQAKQSPNTLQKTYVQIPTFYRDFFCNGTVSRSLQAKGGKIKCIIWQRLV